MIGIGYACFTILVRSCAEYESVIKRSRIFFFRNTPYVEIVCEEIYEFLNIYIKRKILVALTNCDSTKEKAHT